ncbi:MAG: ferric reductase-like transmembrane domain-containing protein [Ilumatobacteraceae bacterium]
MLSTKAFRTSAGPLWLLDLHRWLGGLTVTFVAFHIAALVADSYVQFGARDILVPYATSWKPGAIALGIVSMYLLAAVQATSMAMKKIPRKYWRIVHLSSYVVFWLTSLHAAFAGSDTTSPLYQATAVASIGAVAWAAMYRVSNRKSLRSAARTRATLPPPDAAQVPARAGAGVAGAPLNGVGATASGS